MLFIPERADYCFEPPPAFMSSIVDNLSLNTNSITFELERLGVLEGYEAGGSDISRRISPYKES